MFVEAETDRRYFGYNPMFAKRVRERKARVALEARQKEALEEAERKANKTRALTPAQLEEYRIREHIRAISVGERGATFRKIELRARYVFRLSKSELYSNSRNKRLILARQFIMYWAARRTTLSLPQIGRIMGGLDHTTIMHGKKVYVEKRAAQGRTLRKAR